MMKKILLTIVLAGTFVFTSCGGASNAENKGTGAVAETTVVEATEAVLKNVSGLCEMCKERIETAAKSVDGVSHAIWNGETKELNVKFDAKKADIDKISRAVAAVGHDTETHKADDAVYDALPSCCKYR